MPVSVVMPALEMAQETGKLISWLKQEGEMVARGEPLLEIETDKAVVEVESSAEGILAGIKAQPGEQVPVGQVIAWLVKPGETIPEEANTAVETESPAARAQPAAQMPVANETRPRKISPKARRLAEQAGIDLETIRSSGSDGELLACDVQAALKEREGQKNAGTSQPLSAVHRLMAERTTQSWTTAPHFFLQREVNASGLIEFRAAAGEDGGIRITHTDLLVALTGRALVRHPRVNAAWAGDTITLNAEVHIGLAIAVEAGVVAPVIRHANRATVAEIAAQRRDLAERARSGRLQPGDLTGATFTISNLGMFGVDAFCAIIVPPQAAILAVGRIVDRVVAEEGSAVVQPMLTLTLSADHRVLDGAKAAAFLLELAETIREPKLHLS